jgi:hypothetical protein
VGGLAECTGEDQTGPVVLDKLNNASPDFTTEENPIVQGVGITAIDRRLNDFAADLEVLEPAPPLLFSRARLRSSTAGDDSTEASGSTKSEGSAAPPPRATASSC